MISERNKGNDVRFSINGHLLDNTMSHSESSESKGGGKNRNPHFARSLYETGEMIE